jgi:hypothetical protein
MICRFRHGRARDGAMGPKSGSAEDHGGSFPPGWPVEGKRTRNLFICQAEIKPTTKTEGG